MCSAKTARCLLYACRIVFQNQWIDTCHADIYFVSSECVASSRHFAISLLSCPFPSPNMLEISWIRASSFRVSTFISTHCNTEAWSFSPKGICLLTHKCKSPHAATCGRCVTQITWVPLFVSWRNASPI